MRGLRSHLLEAGPGLVTNAAPQAVVGVGMIEAKNVDGFEQFRGAAGKVPGSVRVSNTFGSAVVSLHQLVGFDLDRQLKRHQLGLASGGTLSRINPDLTLTTLDTGWFGEAVPDARQLNRLYMSSPNQWGFPTGGRSYDFSLVRNWGVLAPGKREIVVQAIDSAADWTTSVDATDSTNTTVKRDAVAGVQVDKTGATVTDAYIERTGLSHDLSTAGQGQLLVWLFVPSGGIQELHTDGTPLTTDYAAQVVLGTGGFVNSNEYNFPVGAISPGWNLLSIVLAAPTVVNGTGAVLSGVTAIRLRLRFSSTAGSSTNPRRAGWVWDRMYVPDNGRPTPSIGGTGTLNGTYSYRVSFLTDQGTLSNGGPVSSSVSPTGASAVGTLTNSGSTAPADGATVTIGLTVYTWRTAIVGSFDVLIGASDVTAITNLVAAINRSAGEGSLYGFGTVAHPSVTAAVVGGNDMTVTARTPGTAGNSIVTTETSAQHSWGGGTLSGGTNGSVVTLASVPTSTDTQVIARRIYRDVAADAIYRFVGQIDDNVTTAFTDDVPDASLGTEQPPLEADSLIDHSPPGRCAAITLHEGRLLAVDADDRFLVKVFEVGDPEVRRLADELVFEDEIVAMRPHALGTLLFSSDRVFLLRGDGVNTALSATEATQHAGANGFRSVDSVKSLVVCVREAEVILLANPSDPWVLSSSVADRLDGRPGVTGLEKVGLGDLSFLVHDRGRNRLALFARSDGSSVTDRCHVWQYGTTGAQQITGQGPGVDPQDIRVGGWWELVLPVSVDPRCALAVERAVEEAELWIGGGDGFVYRLTVQGTSTYATGVTTAAVDAAMEWNAAPLGLGTAGRGEPRFLQVNGYAETSAVWTAEVDLLTHGGAKLLSTVSRTFTLGPGHTAPLIPLSGGGRRAEWARVRLSQGTSTGVGRVKSAELFYLPRTGFRGPRAA